MALEQAVIVNRHFLFGLSLEPIQVRKVPYSNNLGPLCPSRGDFSSIFLSAAPMSEFLHLEHTAAVANQVDVNSLALADFFDLTGVIEVSCRDITIPQRRSTAVGTRCLVRVRRSTTQNSAQQIER